MLTEASACTSPRVVSGKNGRLPGAEEAAMEFSQFLQEAESKILKLVPRKRGPRGNQYKAQSLFDRFLLEHGDTVNPTKRRYTSRRSIDSQTSASTTSSSASQQMSKSEFAHCMSVMRSWYQRLPILIARGTKSHVSSECDINANVTDKRPIIYEVPEGLDIKFGLGVLANVLKCPLCHGLFCNAHTIKECMHTFCKSCIVLSTLQYGLACPECNVPLSADVLESIEYDHNIQGLVDKIFPHFREQEIDEKETLNKILGKEHLYNTAYVKGGRGDIEINRYTPSSNSQSEQDEQVMGDDYDASKCGEGLRDVTMPFLDFFLEHGKDTLSTLNENVACLALLHESDVSNLEEMFKDVDAYIAPGDLMAKKLKNSRGRGVFQRRFLCVPKTTFVAEIINFMMHSFGLNTSVKIALLLDSCPLPKSHTIEFICKSRRIDLGKCILLRYKIFE